FEQACALAYRIASTTALGLTRKRPAAVDHIQLDRLGRRVMQEMDALFRQVDVLLSPEHTDSLRPRRMTASHAAAGSDGSRTSLACKCRPLAGIFSYSVQLNNDAYR